jgi:glucose/arabinose dehydrogenase
VVARALQQPWSLAFLPDGDILITERPGRLRVVRSGTLDPHPVRVFLRSERMVFRD